MLYYKYRIFSYTLSSHIFLGYHITIYVYITYIMNFRLLSSIIYLLYCAIICFKLEQTTLDSSIEYYTISYLTTRHYSMRIMCYNMLHFCMPYYCYTISYNTLLNSAIKCLRLILLTTIIIKCFL